MKILVKLGGTLLETEASRARLAAEISAIRDHQVTVVHGGGKQMTKFLAERGVESRFVDGLRVTTPEVIDAVLKVFAGTVNHELVASFVAAGSAAVGLTGIDACLTEAELLREELGQVGKPARANAGLLDVLCGNGYLPVVACVAGDRQGRIYNVNADQMAVACAAGWAADRLFFLTDVPGVKGGGGEVLPELDAPACRALISAGVATGGMQAKLESACEALAQGVGEVWIVPGAQPGLLADLLAGGSFGTRLVPHA